MRTGHVVAIGVVVLAIGCARCVAGERVELARDGKAMGPIYVVDPGGKLAKDRRGWIKPSVEDLKNCLEKITGAAFEVKWVEAIEQNPGPGIYVGRDADLKNAGVGEKLDAAKQELLVRTMAGRVVLAGADERGIMNAVYAFLYEMGCRWYYPGEAFAIVPRRSELNVMLDVRDAPAFPIQRRIWTGHGEHSAVMRKELADWRRRNRVAEPFGVAIAHTWFGLDPVRDFAAHPEWFALVDGKRGATKPCYSHPQVIAKGIETAINYFEKNPDATMFSVSAPDGLGYCTCGLCRQRAQVEAVYDAHGAIYGKRSDGREVSVVSETIFHFANEVAREVGKRFPGKRIGILAYSAYAHPPTFALERNIYVELTAGFRRTPLTMEQQIVAFGKLAECLGIYEYFDVEQWSWERPGKARASQLDELSKTMRFYRENNLRALSGEMSDNFGPNGIGYYVIARLLWDAKADVRRIEEEFYHDCFGPSAEVVKRVYRRWEKGEGWEGEGLRQTLADLESAAAAAGGDSALRERLERLKMYAHFLAIYLQPNAQGGEAKDVEAWKKQFGEAGARRRVEELAAWCRRLADTHMIHGLAFNKYLVKRGAMLGCDTAEWLKPAAAPTSAEVEEIFRKDLGRARK